MFLTNHTLAALLIAEGSDNYLIVAPAAFASHFVLDALPHFGYGPGVSMTAKFGQTRVMFFAVGDFAISAAITAAYIAARPQKTYLYLAAMGSALFPDFLWFVKEAWHLKDNWFFRFHGGIQTGEHPYGWIYEIGYAVALVALRLTVFK